VTAARHRRRTARLRALMTIFEGLLADLARAG